MRRRRCAAGTVCTTTLYIFVLLGQDTTVPSLISQERRQSLCHWRTDRRFMKQVDMYPANDTAIRMDVASSRILHSPCDVSLPLMLFGLEQNAPTECVSFLSTTGLLSNLTGSLESISKALWPVSMSPWLCT